MGRRKKSEDDDAKMREVETYTLLGEHGDPAFIARVREELAPTLLGFFHLEKHPCRELIVTFLSAALSQTLSAWYGSGKLLAEEELAALLSNFLCHGLSAVNPSGAAGRLSFLLSRP